MKITRATISEPVVASETQDRPRRQARRGRARDVQPGRARRSARSGRTRAARGRPRDRARPARQRRRPGRGGAADREHLHPQGHDRHHPRAHPADARRSTATGDAISDVDPGGRARRLATPPPPRRSSPPRCRTTTGRPSSAPTRSARASSRRRSRSPTAARWTSPSASTSRPNGRNLGGGGVKQGAGVTPEVLVPHGVDTAARPGRGAEHARRESEVSARGGPAAPRARCRGGARAARALPDRRAAVPAAGPRRAPPRRRGRGARDARVGSVRRRRQDPGAPPATSCSCRRARGADPAGARVVRVLGRPDVARDVIEGLMLDRGLARGLRPGGGARGARGRRAWSGTRDVGQARPARAADVHDRPGQRARLRRRDLGRDASTSGAGAIGCGCTSPTSPPTCPRARSWTARRAGAPPACTCPGRSSRCCPQALSNDACSLVPGADRPAVTVELELHGASVARAAFYRSLIRSDERLDYERVDRIFAGQGVRRRALAGAAARRARGRRGAGSGSASGSGALVLDSEEPEFAFDEHGNVTRDPRARADRVPSPDRAPDDRRQRGRRRPARAARRAVPVSRARAPRARAHRAARRSARLAGGADAAAARAHVLARRPPSSWARSPGASTSTCAAPAGAGRRSARSCCARSSRPTTRPRTSATPACAPPPTATSPRRSVATPTSSATARCCRRSAAREPAPRAGELVELGAWTSEREREAMIDRARRRRRRALLRARAGALRERLRAGVRGGDHRADLRRRVRRVRHARRRGGGAGGGAAVRGHAPGQAPARARTDRRERSPEGRSAEQGRPARQRRRRPAWTPAPAASRIEGASGGSSTSRARSSTASAPARRCASAIRSRCAWRAWTRSAAASTCTRG